MAFIARSCVHHQSYLGFESGGIERILRCGPVHAQKPSPQRRHPCHSQNPITMNEYHADEGMPVFSHDDRRNSWNPRHSSLAVGKDTCIVSTAFMAFLNSGVVKHQTVNGLVPIVPLHHTTKKKSQTGTHTKGIPCACDITNII